MVNPCSTLRSCMTWGSKGLTDWGFRVGMFKHPFTAADPVLFNEKWWTIVARWWFQIFLSFTPYLGKMSNLTNIVQTGWNHQLGIFSVAHRIHGTGIFTYIFSSIFYGFHVGKYTKSRLMDPMAYGFLFGISKTKKAPNKTPRLLRIFHRLVVVFSLQTNFKRTLSSVKGRSFQMFLTFGKPSKWSWEKRTLWYWCSDLFGARDDVFSYERRS